MGLGEILQFAVSVNHKHGSSHISLEIADGEKGVLNVAPQDVSLVCFWTEVGRKAGESCMIPGFELLKSIIRILCVLWRQHGELLQGRNGMVWVCVCVSVEEDGSVCCEGKEKKKEANKQEAAVKCSFAHRQVQLWMCSKMLSYFFLFRNLFLHLRLLGPLAPWSQALMSTRFLIDVMGDRDNFSWDALLRKGSLW